MIEQKNHKKTFDVPPITICIPTYNRGDRLLAGIRSYLHELDERWPLLILDNCSTKTRGYYKEIINLCDTQNHISYHRQEKNVGLEGNLISICEKVTSQYALVISDEDIPNFSFLRTFFAFLSDNAQIGSIRTSVQPTKGHKGMCSGIFSDKVFEPGAEGISEFSVIGNYVSGQIWNVRLINEKGILKKFRENLSAHNSYPHVYLNILLAAETPTMTTSAVGVFEGKNYGDASLVEATGYFGAYSYGKRLDQFIALRDALLDAFFISDPSKFQAKDFFNAYVKLCAKFLMLVCGANAKQYAKHGLDITAIAHAFALFAIAAVARVPEYKGYESQLISNVDNVKESMLSKYGTMLGY